MPLSVEASVRLGFFFGVLGLMAVWEGMAPRRRLVAGRGWRWGSNLGLVGMNTVLARVVVPVTAVGGAIFAEGRGWGLLNLVGWPWWVEAAAGVAALDLAIYLQHVMFHAVPALWRLHMVHHADLDFDVTTGVRFHSLEILLSALIKLGVVLLVGPPAVAVLIFEVLLNATSMFNHGNVRMPSWLDRIVRLVVVTPEMHRVHHSIKRHETNSNFGFNFPWWDRLLGTYRAVAEEPQETMPIGLEGLRDEREVDRLPGMLLLPFRRRPAAYALGEKREE